MTLEWLEHPNFKARVSGKVFMESVSIGQTYLEIAERTNYNDYDPVFRKAKERWHAARELELFRHDLSSALTHLFIEALRQRELQRPGPTVDAVEVIEPTPEVALPEIPAQHRTITSQR